MQDVRAVLSFTLGAILCRLMTAEEQCEQPAESFEPDKAHLYTFML